MRERSIAGQHWQDGAGEPLEAAGEGRRRRLHSRAEAVDPRRGHVCADFVEQRRSVGDSIAEDEANQLERRLADGRPQQIGQSALLESVGLAMRLRTVATY